MTLRFGAALSEHPILAHATGEVVGQVLDAVGERPDIAVMFVTGQSSGALEDIRDTVRATLRPRILLGVTGTGVLANEREVENAAAISLWAGRVGGCVPLRFEGRPFGEEFEAIPADLDEGTLILLADPLSFPVEGFLGVLRRERPAVTVIGGLASASSRLGGNRLVLDEEMHVSGAVGVMVPPGAASTVVSQGCRPVGVPLTVTGAEGRRLTELAGRPATARVEEILAQSDDPQRLLQHGLQLGVVVDEHKLEFTRGDFLVRGVGIDRSSGAVLVADDVEVGQTVQFHVRDADSAADDLREMMAEKVAAGALVFTCAERGSRLFELADHDASTIYEALDRAPLGGVFCAGELGPLGKENHLHAFTASAVLFT